MLTLLLSIGYPLPEFKMSWYFYVAINQASGTKLSVIPNKQKGFNVLGPNREHQPQWWVKHCWRQVVYNSHGLQIYTV